MGEFNLSTLDIIIMVLYAVFIIGYGLYHAKRNSSEEYFLGGRSATWPVIGIALFAANISSSTLVGLAGSAYSGNTHVYNYEWFAVVVLIFFAIFFLPFYLKSRVYTMPEFLERRYDSKSRYYFSFITIVGNVLIDTAASLYVGTLVLSLIFPDIPGTYIIIGLAFAAAAYTIPGGLNSVMQTEVIQAIILIFGSIVLTYYAFDGIGGWDGLISGLDARQAAGLSELNAQETLSLVRSADDEFMPWTGLVLGVPLLGFYFWANNQFMVQRVLSAKDLNHGRWGALFGGLLKLPVLFFMVFPGTAAILLFADLPVNYLLADGTICTNLADCTDFTYPTLLYKLLPSGLLGLVVAGLLAAMMSSISATFNSASTLITMDFIQKIKPDMTSKQLVRAGQISTVVLVILASLWAPQIGKYGDLFKYLQDVLGFIAPPVVATFLLGMFWKRANGWGSIASFILSLVFSIVFVAGAIAGMKTGFWSLNFLIRTFVLFAICSVTHIVVSLLTPAPAPEKLDGYTWNNEILRQETIELKGLPWYQNYRILSVLLLILTAIIVGWFW